MQFTISKQSLSRMINTVIRAVATRTTVPALTHIRFETYDSFCRASATDLEIALSCEEALPALLPDENCGSVAIPARLLQQIVSTLPVGDVFISTDEKFNVTIKSGKNKFTINGLPGDDFPEWPRIEGTTFTIDSIDCKRLINHSIFAASEDQSRAMLVGICLQLNSENNTIESIATDTHCLAHDIAHIDVEDDAKFILPSRTASEILRSVESGNVEITYNETQIAVIANGVQLTSRMIDGKFLDHTRVIPVQSKCPQVITCAKDDLLNALRRVSLVSWGENNRIGLSIEPLLGTMKVFAKNGEVGSAEEEIAVEYNNSDNFLMYFNSKLMLNYLQAVTAKEVSLYAQGNALYALLMTASGDDNKNYQYVVMPMQAI